MLDTNTQFLQEKKTPTKAQIFFQLQLTAHNYKIFTTSTKEKPLPIA